MQDFEFNPPLSKARIMRPKSQFAFIVLHDGRELAFHCPTTGRIGNLDLSGRSCLVRLAMGEGRNSAGIVEAISFARSEDTPSSGLASTRTRPTATSSSMSAIRWFSQVFI